jgi:hypothetical protein
MNRNKEPKIAVLRMPADVWDKMTPQQQLLALMQQMLGFMASDFFSTAEGVVVQICDMQNLAGIKVVLNIGQKPDTGGLITLN